MKQKHFYTPPVVETMPLKMESIICTSGDPVDSQVGFGWMSTDWDLSSYFDIL